MAEALKHVALDGLHRELGARMGGFAGYDMPIQYSGLKAEHLATRASCGLFDVSHMGQLLVRPRDGRIETLHAQLEACLPLDFSDWPEGAQRYSLLLNERGGIEDDLMLVNLGSEVRIIVNAGNRDHDFHLLTTRCPELEFTWIDAALIALQGPQAEAVLAALDPRARSPRFMESVSLELLGVPCFATRSGYTGEDGYEISIPTAEAEPLVLSVPERIPKAGRDGDVMVAEKDFAVALRQRIDAAIIHHVSDALPSGRRATASVRRRADGSLYSVTDPPVVGHDQALSADDVDALGALERRARDGVGLPTP